MASVTQQQLGISGSEGTPVMTPEPSPESSRPAALPPGHARDCRARVEAYFRRWLPVIETVLADHVHRECDLDDRLREPLQHLLAAGGKRFRPLLTLVACELVGGTADDAIDVSCAIECFHTSSLILDDLPSMDDAALSRGVPCVHVRYGEATAILASLAFFNLGHKLLASSWPADAPIRECRHRCVADALGPRGMIGGQHIDLLLAKRAVPNAAALEDQKLLKTSSLISAAVVAGAYTGAASTAQIDALAGFGCDLGCAFQLRDDTLDAAEDGEAPLTGASTIDRALLLRLRAERATARLRSVFATSSPARDVLEGITYLAIERDH